MTPDVDSQASRVLISPGLDEADRSLLEANEWALTARSAPAPARPVQVPAGVNTALNPMLLFAPALLCLVSAGLFFLFNVLYQADQPVHVAIPAVSWARWMLEVAAVLGTAGVCATIAAAIQSPAGRRIARRAAELHGSYLLPDRDLDGPGQDLLARARAAAESITVSRVLRDDVLDVADHNARLPGLLWALGEDLADLKVLRARIDGATRGEESEIQAVARIHREAIDKRYRDLETRTAALEGYAREVADLDRLYRAAKTAEELDGVAIEFEAVREIRDEAELAEVAGLSGRLPAHRAVLDAELRRVHEQFAALDSAT